MNTLRRNGLAVTALVLVAASTLYAWGRVPERLPVHWNLAGEADRIGSRLEALGVLPLTIVLLYGIAFALPRLVARPSRNDRLAGTVLRITALGLTGLHLGLVAKHLGMDLSVTRLAGLVVGVILIGTGNLLPKARPSRWIGLRTPWTLTSEESWHRSQRAGGWMLTLSGLAFLVTAITTASPVALFAVVAATILGVLGLTYYGFRVWRDDVRRDDVGRTDAGGERGV